MREKTAEERAEEAINQQARAFRQKYEGSLNSMWEGYEEEKRSEARKKKKQEINAFFNQKASPLAWFVVLLIIAAILAFAYLIAEVTTK